MRKVIIFALLIFVLITLSCSKSESYIKSKIEEANYCNTKEDCVNVGNKCPFGCYVYVNKNEADKISNLVNSYKSNCIYACIPCLDVECKNNRCEPICE